MEIQTDEYGNGRLDRMHAELFRCTLDRLGLDTAYAAHLDAVPAVTLATNNLMSLLGLHRRLRGALLGHLAAFEMTSSLPNRRYGNGLRRLGFDEVATRFYDEHVEADAVHEQIAAHDMWRPGPRRTSPRSRRALRCGGRAGAGPAVRRAPAGQLGRRPKLAAVARPPALPPTVSLAVTAPTAAVTPPARPAVV
ncbi:iron-containing redox enzyme family protein [Micromonospora sp. M12]